MVKFSKNLEISLKVKKVFIEITNICGLNCTFCPPNGRKNAVMSLDFFDKINQQLQNVCHEIALHIVGDPMVLSNLNDYIEISSKYNQKINITTSGFYMSPDKFSWFKNKNIKQVNFSINSYNSNPEKISFDLYSKNIFEFIKYKQDNNLDFFINLRLWNLDDNNSANQFNNIFIDKINNKFDTKIDLNSIDKKTSLRIQNKVLIAFDEYFEWPDLKSNHFSDGFCLGLNSHFGILCDGTVVPCCLDKNGVINLGNLHQVSLNEILTSSKTINIKQGFANNICTEELCKKCTYRLKFNK